VTPHPSLSLAQVGMCGAARIPPPPRQAVRDMDRVGVVTYELESPRAVWKFRPATDMAKGEPGVTLTCFQPDREAAIAAINALP